MLSRNQIKAAIEAILFARSDAINLKDLAHIVGISVTDADIVLKELILEYNERESGIQIASGPDGYVMCTRPDYYEYVKKAHAPAAVKLSQAAIETLAIIAYRQPVTRAEIEAIRGVKVDRIITSLSNRGLVEETGKKEAPGRPGLYATTTEFLKLFGLTSLDELPRKPEEAKQ
jgi:segregation and condensation protein B